MVEKRKHPRKIASRHIGLYENESQRLIGCLIDLNICGMRIMCEDTMDIGKTKRFTIALPAEFNNQKELRLTTKIIWCNVSSDPRFYSIGFQFTNASEEVNDILHQLLESDSFEKIASFTLF